MTEDHIREEVLKHLRSKIGQQLNVFKALKAPEAPDFFWQSWSFKKEYLIRFGRNWTGRADLVLLLDNKPVVIVECKAPGLIGRGKIQLESYLNASRANLGIFTNNPDPDKWRYYDNSIGFNEISRSTFWEKIRAVFDTELDIEKEAQQLKLQRIETRAKELANAKQDTVQKRANEIIEERAKWRVTENAIQSAVAQKLQEQLDASRNNAMLGWVSFGISAIVILFLLIALNI